MLPRLALFDSLSPSLWLHFAENRPRSYECYVEGNASTVTVYNRTQISHKIFINEKFYFYFYTGGFTFGFSLYYDSSVNPSDRASQFRKLCPMCQINYYYYYLLLYVLLLWLMNKFIMKNTLVPTFDTYFRQIDILNCLCGIDRPITV